MDDEGESILQPNIQFAFLSALMGLQKEKSGSKIFQIGLWQEKNDRPGDDGTLRSV